MAVIQREPGRPRKVVRRRTARMQERVSAFHEAAERFAATDRVSQAVGGDDRLEALYVAREEIAREAAGLLFDRLRAAPGSRELGRLSTRRIAALREVTNLTLAIARVDAEAPSPERMTRIMRSLVDVVDDVAESVLPAEVAAKFRVEWYARVVPHLVAFGAPGKVADVTPEPKKP